jgi:hypothetical protein
MMRAARRLFADYPGKRDRRPRGRLLASQASGSLHRCLGSTAAPCRSLVAARGDRGPAVERLAAVPAMADRLCVTAPVEHLASAAAEALGRASDAAFVGDTVSSHGLLNRRERGNSSAFVAISSFRNRPAHFGAADFASLDVASALVAPVTPGTRSTLAAGPPRGRARAFATGTHRTSHASYDAPARRLSAADPRRGFWRT